MGNSPCDVARAGNCPVGRAICWSRAGMYRSIRVIFLTLLPGLVCLAPGLEANAAPVTITVMTQNLYGGADTPPLLEAPDLATAAALAADAFKQVVANNFPA